MKELEHRDVTAAALRLLGFEADPDRLFDLLGGQRIVLILNSRRAGYFCDCQTEDGYFWNFGALHESEPVGSPPTEFVAAVHAAVRALAEGTRGKGQGGREEG